MIENKEPAAAGAAKLCLPPALLGPRLRRKEASEYLRLAHGIQVAPTTLAKLACVGGGPCYQKHNRTPIYPTAELDAWAAEKLGAILRNTSQSEDE